MAGLTPIAYASCQGRQDEGLPNPGIELDGKSASQWYQWDLGG